MGYKNLLKYGVFLGLTALLVIFLFRIGMRGAESGANVTYLTALAGGMLSFLSPCVLPLVPPYLGFMAGASIKDLADTETAKESGLRSRVIKSALLFVLGFSLVFMALGAGASSIGQLVRAHIDTLQIVAGGVIIVMGLHFLGLFQIGALQREARFRSTTGGYVGSFLMGLAFAFGWTPCIGPILGPILGLAGTKESIWGGASLLAVYSAGLGIPFLLAAIFIEPFMRFLSRFKRHLGLVEKAMGVMLVAAGIAFITGGMQTFAFWMLEMFPGLAQFG